MAWISYANRTRWIGLSTETKPDATNIAPGATAFERDTRTLWTTDGEEWYLGPADGQQITPDLLTLHRSGITAADPAGYPIGAWVENPRGLNNALVHFFGATWAADDTGLAFVWRIWRRSLGGAPQRAGRLLVNAANGGVTAKYAADVTNVGAITWQDESLIDAGEPNFEPVRPVTSGDPSIHIVTAEPADFLTAPIFGWPTYGGVPPAIQIATGHLPIFEEIGDEMVQTNIGWVGGTTPTTEAAYSIRKPNINLTESLPDLGGAAFALMLESVTGDGFYGMDAAVQLY